MLPACYTVVWVTNRPHPSQQKQSQVCMLHNNSTCMQSLAFSPHLSFPPIRWQGSDIAQKACLTYKVTKSRIHQGLSRLIEHQGCNKTMILKWNPEKIKGFKSKTATRVWFEKGSNPTPVYGSPPQSPKPHGASLTVRGGGIYDQRFCVLLQKMSMARQRTGGIRR